MSETHVAQSLPVVTRGGAAVDRGLRLIELDEGFIELAGAGRDALLGREVGGLFPELVAPLREVLTTGHALARVPLRRDGLAPVGLRLSPLRTSRGTVAGVELLVEPAPAARPLPRAGGPWATFEHTPLGIAHVTPAGRWIHVNERLAAIVGYTVDELLSTGSFATITHPADLAADLAQLERLLAGEIDAYDLEKRYLRKGGGAVWVNLTVSLVRGADGAPDYLVAVVEDITSRKAAEAEREELLARERAARAQADEALALLDTLVDTAPIGMCFLGPDFRYLRINDALARMNGVPAAEHLGRTVREVLPDLAPHVEPLFERVLATGEPIVDVELVEGRPPGAGERRIWRASYYPVRLPDGTIAGLGSIANDITAYRAAAEALRLSEERLRESEARYSALAEAVPAILFTHRPDGSNEYLSKNYYDYTGAPRGSGEGYGWVEQLHPDDRVGTARAWQAAVRTGTPLLIEYRLRRHDGAYRWFRVKGRPLTDAEGKTVRWFGVCLDIDDARHAAAEREGLLAREQVARAAAERSAARLAQLQAVTAALSEALTPAQVAAVIVGRSAEALGASGGDLWLLAPDGRTLEALAGGEGAEPWVRLAIDAASPICEVARTGRPLYFEGRRALAATYPDLAPGDAEAVAVVPLGGEGRAIGALALRFAEPRALAAEDRDTLLAMARQAAQAIERARLYDAARGAVEARDNFIAIASHDLRSPLAALLGQAQLLERRAHDPQPEQIGRRARLIVDQTQRLNRMINTLLDLSRIQSGQLTIDVAPLDLAALVARVVDEIRPTLYRHTLELLGDAAGLTIAGDEVRLEHVLYNLINNAVKYSPEGGPVMVRVERQGAMASVAVSDSGIGVPAEALPRLFERYYRAANAVASGLGVGLYAVREIVALHGGTVAVASEEAVGSTFTFTLPLA